MEHVAREAEELVKVISDPVIASLLQKLVTVMTSLSDGMNKLLKKSNKPLEFVGATTTTIGEKWNAAPALTYSQVAAQLPSVGRNLEWMQQNSRRNIPAAFNMDRRQTQAQQMPRMRRGSAQRLRIMGNKKN